MTKRERSSSEAVECREPTTRDGEAATAELHFRPSHPQQVEALECCHQNAVIFLTGPAGSAKTYVATYYALSCALDRASRVRKVYMSRPAVTQGKEIGFIPGDIDAKMNPFLRPIINAYSKQLGYDAAKIEKIKELIEFLPTSYIRGWTFENSILIVDEAQNLRGSEIKAICTRLGKGGKIILCGDYTQSDIRKSMIEVAAADMQHLSRRGRSVGWHQFTHDAIVRDPLTAAIVEHTEHADWAQD